MERPFFMMSRRQHCMSGAMNNVSSDGNCTTGNNTAKSSASLLGAAAAAATCRPCATIRDDAAISTVLYVGCNE